MTTNEITAILKSLNFKSMYNFKRYMLSKTNLNEYDAICYTEKKDNLTLNYSHNCKSKYGIGGYVKGQFVDVRFN